MKKSDYELSAKILRLANRGARKAQEKARRAGVPVYYSINGQIIEVKVIILSPPTWRFSFYNFYAIIFPML